MTATNPLADDLNLVLKHTGPLWPELRGQRIFITGGTGFFGRWLLESFAWANAHLALKAEAVVLTRHPGAFAEKAPHLANNPAIRLHAGDVREFDFPVGRFSHVIHGATEASAKLNAEDPLLMFDTIVAGTRRALEFAAQARTRKFLFISSGAVYGRQPPELSHIPEDFTGAPDPTNPLGAYGEGKRAGEMISVLMAQRHGFEAKIARCFAFVGPHLPLDAHFAIGNFIRDALRGGPIQVNGDGTPVRSYLYAADLAIWLWTILLKGHPGRAYNVGSEATTTIAELAATVALAVTPPAATQITKAIIPNQISERYVPATHRALAELKLQPSISLSKAIQKTTPWAKTVPAPPQSPEGRPRLS